MNTLGCLTLAVLGPLSEPELKILCITRGLLPNSSWEILSELSCKSNSKVFNRKNPNLVTKGLKSYEYSFYFTGKCGSLISERRLCDWSHENCTVAVTLSNSKV